MVLSRMCESGSIRKQHEGERRKMSYDFARIQRLSI